MSQSTANVLVIDDHDIFRDVLIDLLKEEKYNTFGAPTGQDGIEIVKNKSNCIEIAIVDIVLPGINGIETIEEIKKIAPTIKSIVITGQPQNVSMREIVLAKADDYITKPFEIDDLNHSIKKLLKEQKLEKQNIELQNELIEKQKLAIIGKLASFIIHDIKNPLSNIKSLVSEIKTKQNQQLIEIIENSINNLYSLTSDLLILSSSPKIELDVYPTFVFNDLLRKIIGSNKVIKFTISVKAYIEINIDYIERVIKNLVSNSLEVIESNPKGEIFIELKEKEDFVFLTIKNNGPKIKNKEIIFQPFFTTKKSGTGLGLTIVKDLTEKMGISLSVDSLDSHTKFEMKIRKWKKEDN